MEKYIIKKSTIDTIYTDREIAEKDCFEYNKMIYEICGGYSQAYVEKIKE